MADEVNNYERIAEALKKTYAELSAEDVKMVTTSQGGYFSAEPTTYGRDALVVRQALGAPGLIMGLCKHLFGETEEE